MHSYSLGWPRYKVKVSAAVSDCEILRVEDNKRAFALQLPKQVLCLEFETEQEREDWEEELRNVRANPPELLLPTRLTFSMSADNMKL